MAWSYDLKNTKLNTKLAFKHIDSFLQHIFEHFKLFKTNSRRWVEQKVLLGEMAARLSSFEQTLMDRSPRCYIPSFVEIGMQVPAKKIFEVFYLIWA